MSVIKMFVSDSETDTVRCFTSDGDVLYQYTDKELRKPRGLYADDKDNLIVCGYDSHNVQVVTAAGKTGRALLTAKNGLYCPSCVTFRPTDGTLVVGCDGRDDILVYKVS